eukprot:4039507-Alexandrium_andersonii.AAC.1
MCACVGALPASRAPSTAQETMPTKRRRGRAGRCTMSHPTVPVARLCAAPRRDALSTQSSANSFTIAATSGACGITAGKYSMDCQRFAHDHG